MRDLIERLERATGPDSELDEAIALVLGWTHQKMRGDAKPYWRKPGVTEYYMRSIVPAYTASLDAALTLVPEGYAVNNFQIWPGEPSDLTIVGTRREPYGRDRKLAWVHDGTCGRWNATAATPAIALCIAALKAREAAK